MKRITVLLVDDTKIVRDAYRAMLDFDDDIEIVGEAENGRLGVDQCNLLRPEVVLMDVSMPVLNGIDAMRQIRKNFPATAVLMLSTYSDETTIEKAMDLGASGYLVKHIAADSISLAIREVRQGRTFFSETISKHLREKYGKKNS